MIGSKMILKTDEEIEKIRKSCHLVSLTHELIAKELKLGVDGLTLDRLAEEFIRDHGASPSFKGYNNFPNTLCISPNYTVVHGIPNNKPFREGDIVSIDCGVYFGGYHGDCAYSYAMKGLKEEHLTLLKTTKEALYKGISILKAGTKTGDLGYEIQSYCEDRGYGVVRELVGHGVGKNLHELPDVPNFGKKGKGTILKKNSVIAVEPMINQGTKNIVMENDGWTVNTQDYKMSAHYEHTIWVRLDDAEALTSHTELEAAIEKNKDLVKI